MPFKFTSTVISALALASVTGSALAGRLIINNHCNFSIYVRPGGSSSPITLAANSGSYSETITGSGKVDFTGTTPQLPHP